jgi:hypothetical protein
MTTKKVETDKNDKRLSFMEYLNTVILTIIAITCGFLFAMINKVNNNQNEFAKELVRIKTIQDTNVKLIEGIDKRVSTLEFNYLEYVKSWVDANYMRKPQK